MHNFTDVAEYKPENLTPHEFNSILKSFLQSRLTEEQLAEELGLDQPSVRQLIQEGKLYSKRRSVMQRRHKIKRKKKF